MTSSHVEDLDNLKEVIGNMTPDGARNRLLMSIAESLASIADMMEEEKKEPYDWRL